MWSDNETNRDFLNFRYVADTVAEMIIQAKGRPLSIGVSGGWGTGKSSMMKLIADALEKHDKKEGKNEKKFLFVEFNAWLYQGYDDARAALMEVIAQKLIQYSEETKTCSDIVKEKVKELLSRVNWLRAMGILAHTAVPLALGLPPLGLVGEAIGAMTRLGNGEIDQEQFDTAEKVAKKAKDVANSVIKPKPVPLSPPKAIQELRNYFESTLEEMGVTLVVLVDDLDRCLPATAIATLEAMRLFLFLKQTAFVIAADDKMIRAAVKTHFKDINLDDDLVTNYFDKLIQVPVRVPPLGTQDVRAYLILLFIENSSLTDEIRDELRHKVCQQLSCSWQGKRVDRKFVESLIKDCPEELKRQLDLADRLAHLMTTAKEIAGNPRLIKRFLNTLFIRLQLARSQNVTVDEAVLAKLLLFERCGEPKAYLKLVNTINDNSEGKPLFLKDWEEKAANHEEIGELPSEWDTVFTRSWFALAPKFSDIDLRAAIYVSREHIPIITSAYQLSTEAKNLLVSLLELKQKQINKPLVDKLRLLPRYDIETIMHHLLTKARQEQEWGTPLILTACLTVVEADPEQSKHLILFLGQIPVSQLTPAIIPRLGDKVWAKQLIEKWFENTETSKAVKSAISSLNKGIS